jgi:hypothetical protein
MEAMRKLERDIHKMEDPGGLEKDVVAFVVVGVPCMDFVASVSL